MNAFRVCRVIFDHIRLATPVENRALATGAHVDPQQVDDDEHNNNCIICILLYLYANTRNMCTGDRAHDRKQSEHFNYRLARTCVDDR